MATKKSVQKETGTSTQPGQVYSHINSLLYTVRAIAEREDQLCTLMHHLRQEGALSPEITAELHQVLDEIPTEGYLHDLRMLRSSLTLLEDGPTAPRAGRRRAA